MQIIAIGIIVKNLLKFHKRWELAFYKKAGHIFFFLAGAVVLRIGMMILVSHDSEYLHELLIFVNLILHIPLFLIIWLELSTYYNYLSRVHLFYGIVFGARVSFLFTPKLTNVIQIQDTIISYLIPQGLMLVIFDILFIIPLIDILIHIIIKAQEDFVALREKQIYMQFFFLFGLFCLFMLISLFVNKFWSFLFGELGSLILFISLAYLTNKSPSFLILSSVSFSKAMIMRKSMTGLPLASLSDQTQMQDNDRILSSLFQTFPLLLQQSKIYKLDDQSQFHLFQLGKTIIVLEIYEDFMGLLLLNRFHKIAFDSLHRIMLQFTREWKEYYHLNHDSSTPISKKKFINIIKRAKIDLSFVGSL